MKRLTITALVAAAVLTSACAETVGHIAADVHEARQAVEATRQNIVPIRGAGPVQHAMAQESWIHSGMGPVEYEMAKQSWIHTDMGPVQYQMCQDSWVHC